MTRFIRLPALLRLLALSASIAIPFTPLAAHEGHESAGFESGVTEAPFPWTDLEFNNDPNNFQFAIVSDRTGGPRPGIWQDAMMKLNWLQPEFVITVGDMIKGTAPDAEANAADWDEMRKWISVLEMPYFFVAGNHDIQAKVVPGRVLPGDMRRQWEERFGTPYYWFKYRDVLFVQLFSNDGQDQVLSQEQVDYFSEVLAEHKDVRWTMVFVHHPLWAYKHNTGFKQVEKMLKGRPYTVFAGHTHNYAHFERRGMNYYVLASTGGSSPLLGDAFGSFDHVTWVTMKDEGPVITNLRLDGILPDDVTSLEAALLGQDLYRSSVMGKQVFLSGDDGVTGGIALLSYTNQTDFPIQLEGRFFHHHHVSPDPAALDMTIGPGETGYAEIDLQVIEPFSREDELLLEFDGVLSVSHPDYPGLELAGVSTIPLRESDFEATVLETAVFVDHMEVQFVQPPGGASIRYTTDGSEPTEHSPAYDAPFRIGESATIKARLYTDSGYASAVDSLTVEKIPAGQGQLLCHYFENDSKRGREKSMPDWRSYTPTLTRTVSSFDVKEIARRDEEFGMVFYGTMTLPESGEYRFSVVSDDGAELLIDDRVVISDRIKHPSRETFGEPMELQARAYAFELHHFQDKRTMALELHYSFNGGERRAVPFSWFSYH